MALADNETVNVQARGATNEWGNRHDQENEMMKLWSFLFIGLTFLSFTHAARSEKLPPPGSGQSFNDCPECPKMVVVPAGSFMMGSTQSEIRHLIRRYDDHRFENEGPRHKVTISKPFAVGRTHVTRGEFAQFVKGTGYDTTGGCYTVVSNEGKITADASWKNPGFEQTDDHPALCLNLNDANAYINWLNEKVPEKPYRLLSEAEAEYVTRAVTKPGIYPPFSFGNDERDLCKYGNGLDQTFKASGNQPSAWPYLACHDGYTFTAPVGSFKPNAWGVYDVLGNAWTWTQDCWTPDYKDAPKDGSAQTSVDCKYHILRGGSWDEGPQNLRAANRGSIGSEIRNHWIGFRVARTITPLALVDEK